MRKTFPFIIILFTTAAAFAQDGSFTLKQCIDSAIANNIVVYRADIQMQTDAINYRQSKMDRLPNLNGFASQGINQGRSIDPFTNTYSNQQISFSNYGLSTDLLIFKISRSVDRP